jgi:RimJ/RimL family protein N-acetyltransferase
VRLPDDPRLRDGVVALRRHVDRDVGAFDEMRQDLDVQRWALGGPPTGPPTDSLAFYRSTWEAGELAMLAITLEGEDDFLGHTGLFLHGSTFGIAELGYILGPRGRGRGLATRAGRLIARWAFDDLDIERLEARTHPENVASHRVLERLGFTQEGLERSSRRLVYARDRFDAYCWSLLPHELV